MSSCLVDTNVLLFFLTNSPRLSDAARELISEESNAPLISLASFWEIAIKQGKGKLEFPPAAMPSFQSDLEELGFEILPIRWPVMLHASQLPQHHGDPFDRIIIAEAMMRDVAVLSSDRQFDAYDVTRVG